MFLGRAHIAGECKASSSDGLDLLARMPLPLRRPFKQAVEPVALRHRLRLSAAMGGAWYAPFDILARPPQSWPSMVVTPWTPEPACERLLAEAAQAGPAVAAADPACRELMDPLGSFVTFAAIPMVFLVDHLRLDGRAPPRRWVDLLAPEWRGQVVFGGWRPGADQPYGDYNQFLLFCLAEEFGDDGLCAFAAATKGLQHNVVSTRTAGGAGGLGGTVMVLPWLQAEMAPRRRHVSVVWPEDGAYAMPIGFTLRPEAAERLSPLVEMLTGAAFGSVLARNCYPPTIAPLAGAFPTGARLKWPGWERVRAGGMTERAARIGRLFFEVWGG
ncbi:ABC transporter substrate-binding protein [Magnetospirillum aberrantis]|uniref:ABC transporter substrate-binding protein n=1 Tax=Magnetospirillum aberrantis SpK TaxID=908842 RepID=A0A7C9USH1_9PROT|nr:ABC transporter substrate-binding protein [Magnetospirillum aberrantis]NFV79287.1 ABC transporter substrate-binding protein [Magnetospirillum aberrantis SpK]